MNLNNRACLGYDGLTGQHWKLCHQTSLDEYFQQLIQYMVENGFVLSVWKIGPITFLPKPDKPVAASADPKSWCPITFLPSINKVIGKIIMDSVNEDVQVQMSWAQKGRVNKQQLGTTQCTFLLKKIIDHHRQNKTVLCIVFLDASNALKVWNQQ